MPTTKSTAPPPDDPAWSALTAYELPPPWQLAPLGQGLINRTLNLIDGLGRRWVLQRVNPIFSPRVHLDIEAVTAHLAHQGLTTPRLLRTRAGQLWTEDPTGGCWRVMTFLPGRTVERTTEPALLREAGRQVAAFHGALADFSHDFQMVRSGVHDTARHLAGLRQALAAGATHRLWQALAPVATAILAEAEALPPLPQLPSRVVHGDLKISNLRFTDQGQALALLDLDTLGRGPLPVELGDAFRSWCNPVGEEGEGHFSLELFQAALTGYAEVAAGLVTSAEAAALVLGVRTIALELAARFGRDAFEERYFGWDATRFAGAAEHNLVRAISQLALSRSVRRQQVVAEELALRSFPREAVHPISSTVT